MPDRPRPSDLNTVALHGIVDRYQAGDPDAVNQLLRHVASQLERMARKMLRTFPGVSRWEQTDDVFQNATLRLLVAMKEVRPASVRAFFGLAAEMMRRELLDLVRHYQGAQGIGANHASALRSDDNASDAPGLNPADPLGNDNELACWAEFHAAVDRLPAEEREVLSLKFYHGWTQPEIAELFQVDERTIRRRWREACQRLSDELGGRLPDLKE